MKARKIETVQVGSVLVKIYERRRRTANGETRTIWEIADYSHGPRRLLGFSDHAKARQESLRIATAISTGNATGAAISNREGASFGRALELLKPTGVVLELAAANYAEAFRILGSDRIVEAAKEFVRRNPTERPARTVAQVAAELVELKTNRKVGARYLTDLRTRLDTFANVFCVNVDTITSIDVQGWLDRMTVAPRTVKNFRDTVNTLFKFCETRGYIARGENPVSATDRVETRNSEAITIFTPEELARLIDASEKSFKPILAIQAFAGLRSAEVMRLDWEDVHLTKGFIEITALKSKTASRRLVPIVPSLAAWLEGHAKRKGPVWPHSKPYYHEVQAKVAQAAQVTWQHNALRHSFISYRVADISDVARVALEAGNSPAVIFSNYREVVDASTAKSWFAVAPSREKHAIPQA